MIRPVRLLGATFAAAALFVPLAAVPSSADAAAPTWPLAGAVQARTPAAVSTPALRFVDAHVRVRSVAKVDPRNMVYQARWRIPVLPSTSVRLVHGRYEAGYPDKWTYVRRVVAGVVGRDAVKVASIGRFNAAMSMEFLLVLRVRAGRLQVAWIRTSSPDNPYAATLHIARRLLVAHWPACHYIANCSSNPALTVRYTISGSRILRHA